MSKELENKLKELQLKKELLKEENILKEKIKKERDEINHLKNKNNFLYKLFNKDD